MRKLNEKEREILKIKEGRKGRVYDVNRVEYHSLFPRTTLCILEVREPARLLGMNTVTLKLRYGVAMKSKDDIDSPDIGEVISFVRTVDSI